MDDIETECDEEIARISQGSEDEHGTVDQCALQRNTHDSVRHDIPRPMSWDGELSDDEVNYPFCFVSGLIDPIS